MRERKHPMRKVPQDIGTAENAPKVVVAGHICLDIIPSFHSEGMSMKDLFLPGSLVDIGPALIATGGAVSNTGLALYRLGIPTLLVGKVGRDPFGSMVLEMLGDYDSALTKGMIIDHMSSTSYTIVISPPDTDRLFFHCTGANDTFGSEEIPYDNLEGIRIFHFGYPPLMRNMYQNKGKGLEDLFRRVKRRGIVTSLDMAMPDRNSDAGAINWNSVLERSLPHVDIFQPSLDEILYMTDRETFDRLAAQDADANLAGSIDITLLDSLAGRLMEIGSTVIAIKLGDQGLYLRTGSDVECLVPVAGGGTELSKWANRQLLAPCFRTNVAGTTGAGDCTVAGLLAGFLAGMSPADALALAVGVGGCSTEKRDATSGVPDCGAVRKRILAGWGRRDVQIDMRGWRWDEEESLWKGPRDAV